MADAAKPSPPSSGRTSLLEFACSYGNRRNEIAVAQKRGYRIERWTYAQISDDANRFARELEARGIGKGDAVLLWGESSAEWTAAFLGCILRGAVAVPIDNISTGDFALRVARDVQAKLIVRSAMVSAIETPIPILDFEHLHETIAKHSTAPYPAPQLTRTDPLEIIFTSGTTADPRGVVISHGNVLANIEPLEREIQKYLKWERYVHPLRFLNLLPLSHIFGQMMGLFIPPLLGATVIHVDSLKPWETIETIRRERVSVLVTVPRLIESLQREIERDLERDLERDGKLAEFRKRFAESEGRHFLRRWWMFRAIRRRFGWKFWAFVCGGAALPEQTENFWHRLGYAVVQGYGMTETASLITLNHPFRTGRGSIGSAFPGMEIKVDANGEVLVRGENVARSYRRGQESEAVLGTDGWFHTGDLAEVGADGKLYFKGRSKSTIVTSAGMKIYPEDLEKALRKQSGVRDCVVVGLARDGNEEPCAALLLEGSDGDGSQAVAEANKSLAEFQQIRRWFVWPEPDFPRTATQKPALAKIRAAAAEKLNSGVSATGGGVNALVAQITGRPAQGVKDSEALASMSSLDRVELMSAMEDRYQVDLSEAKFTEASTIAQLEQLVREPSAAPADHIFPSWPQSWPIRAIRLAAYYLLVWPATYLLAAPRIRGRDNLRGLQGPALVISNHVTYVDIGWILAALPMRLRHRLATGMRGERIAEMRHPAPGLGWLEKFGERIAYPLVLTFFNVFPLPKESGFLRSFSFIGDLVERRWCVLVFPEGITSVDGKIAPFRSGIGLLAARLNIPVIPMRLDGLFDLKQKNRSFAWPGHVKITVGKPVTFSADQKPEDIARELQRRVEEL